MRRILIAAGTAALLAALLWCGCDTLPAGDPPPGPLADNTPPDAETLTARHNRRVTALISCVFQNGLSALAPADDVAAEVARDAAKVAGFRVLPPGGAVPVLVSGESGMTLRTPGGTVLWRCE